MEKICIYGKIHGYILKANNNCTQSCKIDTWCVAIKIRRKDVISLKHFAALRAFLSVDTVEAAFTLESEEFKAKYGVTKPPQETPELVFHCHMGKRGGVATETARKLGFVK